MKTKLGLVVIALVTAIWVGSATAAEARSASGIIGSVPATVLVELPDGGGLAALPPLIRIYSVSGKLVTEVQAVADGILAHFQIALKPGKYIVWAYYPPVPTPDCNICQVTYSVSVTVKNHNYTSVGELIWKPL